MKFVDLQVCWPRMLSRMALGLLLLLWLQAIGAETTVPLALSDAERIALENDPLVRARMARSEALDADAVADGQLPDPKFRTGLYNVPLDDFDLRREPSTQLRFGIQQAFPRGKTLELKSQKTHLQAQAERTRAKLESLKILRNVRKTYLDIYYQTEAARIVTESRKLFESLAEITQVQYGSGGSSQQDVLRAELELSRLDDRITQIQTREEMARAKLSRWLGQAAWRKLQRAAPSLPRPADEKEIEAVLEQHPEIRLQSNIVATHQQAVAISREQYKPGWTIGAEYRMRFGDNPDDSSRSDMGTVMLAVDMPLFSEKRQDKRLAASQKRADAAYLDRQNSWRMLRELLASASSSRERLEERLQRYQQQLIREAEENAKAALLAYQSGTIEFTGLMRARITELEIHLQALKLRFGLMKIHADLLYLAAGEEQ
ncbi:MAG TPA: TolC family protein [Thiolapillus brandeum]|uniref:TolC family protein n=1 Tax=Thiolapillus brandeum TaxID=1076588 RepID=A0A831K2T5_9GAMM|nr:TolC family protein [Thiolapillus brandeum]